MLFHQLYPGCGFLAVQVVSLGQFNPGHGLQHVQHGFPVDQPLRNLAITMIARLQHQIVRRNRDPEALIVHGLKPLLNVIDGFKSSHLIMIPECDSVTQQLSLRECNE